MWWQFHNNLHCISTPLAPRFQAAPSCGCLTLHLALAVPYHFASNSKTYNSTFRNPPTPACTATSPTYVLRQGSLESQPLLSPHVCSGAGKTFTLGNTDIASIGMIPRAVAEIFNKASEDSFHTFSVTMSYMQIYCELIQDLLNPTSENLVRIMPRLCCTVKLNAVAFIQ